jgi:hypothetical protein
MRLTLVGKGERAPEKVGTRRPRGHRAADDGQTWHGLEGGRR